MAENMIKFLRGNVASLPKTATEGALYFTKDEGVYLGLADGSYHRYGDFIQVNAVADLPTAGAHVNCMYYCVAENILAKWDGKKWVQINKQKTLAELGGVAKSAYDTKMTALEKADRDNATAISNLSTLVGTIPEGVGADTVIAYINKKTEGIATSGNLEALANRVTTAERDIDNLQSAIGEGGSVTVAIADAKKAGTDAASAVDALEAGQVKTNKEAIEAINNETTGILAQAKSYADGKNTAITAAKNAADAAQADVNALETKVGTVPENKTVVQMIEEAKAAATYDDTELAGRVTKIEGDYLKTSDKTTLQTNINAVSDKVTTLIGDDADKSVRTIANEELAAQLIPEGAKESLDTLQEIAAWIQAHPDGASAMNAAIAALQEKVDTGDQKVSEYVTAAINALKIGDYAKASDLTALAARVTTVEGQIATLNGDESTAGSVKKALADAKAYTDGKDSAMDIRVKALETDTHTHANKAELDKIEVGDKAKWDAAQAKAEATAASALSAAKTELEGKISDAKSAAEGKVTELANGAVKANTDAIATINGTGDGSFAKADATLKTNLEAYADQAETDAVATAKAYTESCLTWDEF